MTRLPLLTATLLALCAAVIAVGAVLDFSATAWFLGFLAAGILATLADRDAFYGPRRR